HRPPPEPTADVPALRPADDVPPPEQPAEVPILAPAGPLDSPVVEAPSHVGFWIALTLGGLILVGMMVAGGEARRFALDGFELLPFLGLALFAYGGERSEGL